MIFQVYSVRDHLTGFMTPVLEQNEAVAVRNFSMACDRLKVDSSVMAWRPSDFALYQIGSFDSDSGLVAPLSPPKLICNGDSVSGGKDNA
ncbi:nonstructural protein [Dipodfec virus UOA04_Rod_862]|nr:nonstructural protein [Dipodfec virus UOA04_Rod_862]